MSLRIRLLSMTMSEERSRFRIRKADTEIEYEGKPSDVNVRYKEAFEWIKSVTATSTEQKPPEKERKPDGKKATKYSTKGIAAEVDKLIQAGWLDDDKKSTEVLKELERKAITGVYAQAVDSALRKRVGKTLERKRDSDSNWVYRKIKGD